MCSLLSPDARRRIRKIHDHEQMLAGATHYLVAEANLRKEADECRLLDNPPEAARLDDLADACGMVFDDILAGRRRP